MEFLDKVKNIVASHEGLKLKPYRCTAGKLTIGYGRNIQEVGISKAEAEMMLMNDVAERHLELSRRLGFYATLPESKQIALIDMSFMGIESLMTFKNMFAELSRGNWEGAAKEALNSKWAKDVKENRANDIAKLLRE